MKERPIKTKLDFPNDYELGGWLAKERTYIGIWNKKNGECVANLGGYKLYRLAKAIIRQMDFTYL